jgi:hemoglobin-like flavoprotein
MGVERAQIAAVQTTFERLRPRLDDVVDRFFLRLFAADPRVRRILPKDLAVPRRHAADMLTAIGLWLHRFGEFEPRFAAFGLRHARHGARAEHYRIGHDAVLESLADHLGPSFTPPVRDAWSSALRAATGVMLRSAAGRTAPMRAAA